MKSNLVKKRRLVQPISRHGPSPDNPAKRHSGIDLVRALGVIGVVLYHYSYRFPPSYLYGGTHIDAFAYGKLGVNLFFIVSAFCISGSLDRSQSFVQFLAKRVARLYPAFAMCALATFAIVAVFGLPGRAVSLEVLALNLLWINMVLPVPHVDGAYWTIAFELRFYLLIGIVYFLMRRDYDRVTTFWRVLTLTGIALYFAVWTVEPGVARTALRIIDANVFLHPFGGYFLLGITLFRWDRLTLQHRAINVGLFVAGVACSDYALDEKFVCLGFLPATWLLLRAQHLRVPAPVLWIGLISYPLYLLHQNIGLVIMRETWPANHWFGLRAFIAFMLIAAAAAAINFRLEPPVRRPFERMLEHLGNTLMRRVRRPVHGDDRDAT